MTIQRYISSTRITRASIPDSAETEHYNKLISKARLSADVDPKKYPVYLLDLLDAKPQFVRMNGEIGIIFDRRLLEQIALLQNALDANSSDKDPIVFGFLRILKEQALLTGNLFAVAEADSLSANPYVASTRTTPDDSGCERRTLQELFIIFHLLAHAVANEASDFTATAWEAGKMAFNADSGASWSNVPDEEQIVSWFGRHGNEDLAELEGEAVDDYLRFRDNYHEEIISGAGFDQYALNCLLAYCDSNNISRYSAFVSGFLVLRCIQTLTFMREWIAGPRHYRGYAEWISHRVKILQQRQHIFLAYAEQQRFDESQKEPFERFIDLSERFATTIDAPLMHDVLPKFRVPVATQRPEIWRMSGFDRLDKAKEARVQDGWVRSSADSTFVKL